MSHEATITGAPMNLLHFVTWLVHHTEIEPHVLFLRDGPLVHRFEQVSEVTVVDRFPLGDTLAAAEVGLRQLGSRRAATSLNRIRLTPQLRHLNGYDVIYLNSLASLGVLPYLPKAGLVVSHVHELQVALRTQRPEIRNVLADGPDIWIAASDAVAEMLVTEAGLPVDRVHRHYEFIDTKPLLDYRSDARDIERRRRELGVHPDAAVVMGAGSLDWRKGPDLFVQLATEVRRRTRDPVAFLWVGGDLDGVDMARIRSDMERSDADHVYFVGTARDPVGWFDLADVFALTSREDPYPLVCLEHAVMGHPIVAFRSGGVAELLGRAGGAARLGLVDHLDVGSLAERTLALLGSDALYGDAGRALRNLTIAEHDVSVAAPRLMDELERAAHRYQR